MPLKLIGKFLRILKKNMKIIRPGLYRPKNNINEKKVYGLIHVTGENDKMDNYFNVKNRSNPIHEDELLRNYVYYGPGKEPTPNEKKAKEFVLNNIGDISKLSKENVSSKKETSINETPTKETVNNPTSEIPAHILPATPNKSLDVNSVFIDKIKKKTKFKTAKQQTIIITLDYDVEQIIEQCNFFDININTILSQIVDWNKIQLEKKPSDEEKIEENKEKEKIVVNLDENLQQGLDAIEEIRKKLLMSNQTS